MGKLVENQNDFLSQKSASFAEVNDDPDIPEPLGQIAAEWKGLLAYKIVNTAKGVLS